jgi:hypothetical protein
MTAPATDVISLLTQLVNELSASGSIELLAEDGVTKLTLRKAVAAILWKETFLLDLTDRPRDPTLTDDLLGHILNMRAEVLINQELLAAIGEALKLDTATIIADAKASYAPKVGS